MASAAIAPDITMTHDDQAIYLTLQLARTFLGSLKSSGSGWFR